MSDRDCSTCRWKPAAIKGECRTCYAFRARTGKQRPEHLIVDEGRRILERRPRRGRPPRAA